MTTISGEENDVKRSHSSSLLHKSKSLLHSKYEILIKYTLVPSVPLSIIAILSINPNTWVTSEVHHFYIELIAVILAAVLAFYYILRARILNDNFSLFIGIGFLTSALIDLLHVIVAYVAFDNPIFLKYFIPQTWFAGRIFLSAMLVMAIVKFSTLSRPLLRKEDMYKEQKIKGQGEGLRRQHQLPNKLQKTVVVYLTILAILAASVAISSLFLVFPASVVDDYSIHRPYEIPSLILFIIALFYFYKNQLYKRTDAFYKGLLGYLIVDIFSQIIMSYSAASFDTAHNVAHVLKDAGYFINIIALAISSIRYNSELREINERLEESNKKLREGEELIRVQYEKLKESDNMKNEFINVAAHELRTPIQPILSLTESLHYRIKEPQQRELLDVTIRNAKRLQRLTENILDVTKIESHSLNLNKELFNLKDVLTNTIDDITVNIVRNKEQLDDIKLVYQPRDIFIEADKARITQVVSNLLSNAVKFTETSAKGERRGIINVNIESDDSVAVVSIEDSGTGIDPEIKPRLFDKFASKSYQGTGLGLFISKSIVEAHSGRIWAHNNPDGKGATFSFSLPIRNIITTNQQNYT
ncbi:MAG TPA: ATP-binding protein [Nitrososphaeraceae archaeon]|nr:ATP-binding protein [Nitrososphaeraceae archaeon]